MYDIAVIGGGVIGASVIRELTKFNLKCVVLEKDYDVCCGASKANSGIAHAGFDAKPGTLKAKFNVLGARMMQDYCKELGVKYKNNGALVIAYNEDDKRMLQELLNRGKQNGVSGLELLTKEQLIALEPNISVNAIAALYAKTSAIICPYDLTLASMGNAMDNGACLNLEFEVTKIEKNDDRFNIYSAKGDCVNAAVIINCAGANSGKIAALVGDDIKIGLRRGEYILLDRESGDFVSHTIFCTPTEKGKGILITNTVDGNVLLGPTAEEVEREEKITTEEGLLTVQNKAKAMAENIPFYNTITSFAGIRAYSCDKHDFIIEESSVTPGVIHVAGIESPGLTSAPAIAEYVVNELIGRHFTLEKNKNFNGKRKKEYDFQNMSTQEKNELIKKDPKFGNIICRCEQITEGEIVQALHNNPPACSVDGIKRRTRAGMGRCQGGFCMSRVAEIISRELNIPIEQVTKKGEGSELVTGKTK